MFECVCVFAAKVRRLYDIANVLRSLKLIEKVHVTEEKGRKPAFEWTGPEDFPSVKGKYLSEHTIFPIILHLKGLPYIMTLSQGFLQASHVLDIYMI